MKRQRTYFMFKDLVFQVDKSEITLRQIKITEVKIENEEYKELRKKFNEDIFHIEKRADGWFITEKK